MTFSNDFDGELAAIAVARLIHREGLAAPSVRAVAREANGSASGLLARFDDKERMLVRSARAWTMQFLSQLRGRTAERMADGLVPETEEEYYWTRVLLAWEELGRTSPGIAAAVARVRGDIPWLIRTTVPRGTGGGAGGDSHAFETLELVLWGLWTRQCAGFEPLPSHAALQHWRAAITAIHGGAAAA